MFGRKQREEILRCSFCNKSQNEVRELIAGPTVFICNECVAVCMEIIAATEEEKKKMQTNDQRCGNRESTPPAYQPSDQTARAAEPQGQEVLGWSADVKCGLCRMPILVEEVLAVEQRGFLCRPCVAAIQANAAQEHDSR